MFWALLTLVASIVRSAIALFRSRENQAIVELALRQQLAVYVHRHSRPRLSPLDRAFWVALSRFWPHWRNALVVVRPETVLRWHRKAFRGYWRWISKPGLGRPPISEETKALIARMAKENGWRARKVQAELSKLGIYLGLTTISRYLPRVEPGQDRHQRWMTFLRNHRDVIAGMDFFVVPTVRFTLLYVWFVLDHGRRRVLHFNVTGHPSARWVIQQLRERRFPITQRIAISSSTTMRSSPPRSLVRWRDLESIPSERHCKVPGRMGRRNASWERFVARFSITWSC
jgi:putative transposase